MTRPPRTSPGSTPGKRRRGPPSETRDAADALRVPWDDDASTPSGFGEAPDSSGFGETPQASFDVGATPLSASIADWADEIAKAAASPAPAAAKPRGRPKKSDGTATARERVAGGMNPVAGLDVTLEQAASAPQGGAAEEVDHRLDGRGDLALTGAVPMQLLGLAHVDQLPAATQEIGET